MWPYFQNNTYRVFEKIVNDYILKHLRDYSSRFAHCIPYTLVVIAFFYDINKGQYYTVQYALLLLLITNFIAKCRYFFHVKDNVYDTILCEYFYKNSIPYVNIQQKLYKYTTYISGITSNAIIIGEQGDNVIFSIDEIANYYITDELNAKDEHYLYALARRHNILFLLFIANIYIHIILFKMLSMPLYLILIPLLIMAIIINGKTIHALEQKNKTMFSRHCIENKKYKYFFIILVIIQSILIVYAIIANKLTMIPNEIIIDCIVLP